MWGWLGHMHEIRVEEAISYIVLLLNTKVRYWSKNLIDQRSDGEVASDLLFLLPQS